MGTRVPREQSPVIHYHSPSMQTPASKQLNDAFIFVFVVVFVFVFAFLFVLVFDHDDI